MYRFAHIEYLNLLYALPFFIVLFIIMMIWRKKAMDRFADLKLLKHLSPDTSKYKHGIKFNLILFALTMIILGIANPQIGTKMEEVKREGVDIIIALDVSRSMLAEDIKPNRLENALRSVSKLIERMHNDRIGIIVFAGDAFVQLPLTADYNAAKLFLKSINTNIVPVQGTAIGKSISLAIKSFDTEDEKHKALIIITDGENHEDDAIEMAKEASSKGIVIHTIGMGSPEGVPIPNKKGNQQSGFHKDNDDRVILTKLNENMLQQLANEANGKYIRATNRQDELSFILDEISSMEKKEFESKIFTDYEDRFQYFLGLGLILLFIDIFISERKSRWLEKIGI